MKLKQMYSGPCAFFTTPYNFFLLLGLYVLFSFLALTVQYTTAQTAMPSPQSMSAIAKHSTQIPQYNNGNKMALLITSGDQITGPSFEDAVWTNVAIGSNSIDNNTTDFPKSPGSLLNRNSSSNCTTPTAKAPTNEVPLRTNITIGGKNYIIAYNITGNGNRLNSTAAQAGIATLRLNITSFNDGNLTIDLPRKIIDSKMQGNNDTHYVVSENGRNNIHCVEVKSTQQSRMLGIDFVKGIGQIAIIGSNIFPSNNTAPTVMVPKAPLIVNESSLVLLNGSGSHDLDGEPVTFEWRQTSGPNVELKSGNASFATFTAPTVSNDTRMSFNLRVKDTADLADNATESVVVKDTPQPPLAPSPTGVNPTLALRVIFDNNLPYYFLSIIAAAMVIPLAIDMILAYRERSRENASSVVGMPGLYRTLMTFGVILLVGTVLFYILILITVNINNPNPTLQSLIDVFKNLATILGTALATIIAFYFGMKGKEEASDKAAAAAVAAVTKGTAEDKAPPAVVDTFPRDGASDVSLNSLVSASFSNRMDSSTINTDTFTVKKDGTTTNVPGTVHLSPDGKSCIFRAEQNFSPDTRYLAIIEKAVKDEEGNALVSTKTWLFKTLKSNSSS